MIWVGYVVVGLVAMVLLACVVAGFIRQRGKEHAREQAALQNVWNRAREEADPGDPLHIDLVTREPVRKVPRWTQGDA